MNFQCYLLEFFEKVRVGGRSFHGVCEDLSGQRLGAAGFADDEQGDPQLHTDHHHEDVFLQRLVSCNGWLKTYCPNDFVLASINECKCLILIKEGRANNIGHGVMFLANISILESGFSL